MTRLLWPCLALFACTQATTDEPVAPGAIDLTTPARGAWTDAGPVTASGTAAQLDSITVNGVDATLEGDRFSADITLERGINTLEARGIHADGDAHFVRHSVIAGTFADPAEAVESAAALRVNRAGLKRLGRFAGSMIDPDEIAASALEMNPVYSDTYGLFGWDAVTIDAEIVGVSFSVPSLNATPSSGVLSAEVVIPDIDVAIRTYGDVIGLDFDESAWMLADAAVIDAQLTIDVVNGALDVQLVDPQIEFQNFWFDTSLLPGDIEVWMLEDTVREQLEELLVEQAEAQIPPLLEESLSSLDLSFSSEVMGAPLEVSAAFASATIDSDGIALGVDLDVNIAASGSMMSAGYLAAPTVQPSPDRTAQISASIYDNLLNRVLFEGWNGGLLDLTLSTEDGSLEPIMLLPLKATQGDIAVSAGLPPVIVERNGGLAVQFGELDVRIETPDGELGSSLWLTVAGEVPVRLAVESNELVLDLGTPELTMMVRDSDWGASNEAITQLVEEMLPIEMMLALVGDLSFPLPELEGIGIASAHVGRDDAQAHTNIQIALD